MSVVNNCTLIGRLSREIQMTEGETSIARSSVAVQRSYKDKDGNYGADFISILAFGKNADFLNEYFTKGDPIALRGNIRTGSYTNKEGQKVYTTDVVVDEISFIPGAKKGEDTEEVVEEKSKKKAKKNELPEDGDFMNIPEGEMEDLPW